MVELTEHRATVQILNLHIDNFCLEELLHSLKEGVVLTPNVDHLVRLQKDAELLKLYAMADYKLCDSQILFFTSHFLRTPFRERISGADLFPAFCEFHASNPDIRIFLLGGISGAPEKAAEIINRRLGRKIIVESYSPPFGFEYDDQACLDIIDRINQSQSIVLAIGVGSPKQEKWIYRHKSKLSSVKIFMAIGATINFEAGMVKRSPTWVSNVGLELLYRITAEPQRLWKRYLVEDVHFLWLIFKQMLGLYKTPVSPSLKNPPYLMNKIKVVMLGPSLDQQGGMAGVEKLLVFHSRPELITMRHISTHEEGSILRRLQVFVWALIQVFQQFLWGNVDVVHLHVAERGSVLRIGLLAMIATIFRKPMVMHTHGCEFHLFYTDLPRLGQRWISWIFQQCAYVIALSEGWREYYIAACGLAANKVVVMYNPVEIPPEVPARSAVETVRFVFLGRIGQRKGAFDLIRAFAKLPPEQKMRADLTLAGDGEVEQACRLIRELGLQDRIKLVGWINTKQRDQILGQSDVFILPSWNEGLPIALLEAMAWGLPVITTPIGGIPEMVFDQKNGILVTPGNILQITEAMQRLIQDEPLRLAMGKNSRQQVLPLNIDRYHEVLQSIYKSVVVVPSHFIDNSSVTSKPS